MMRVIKHLIETIEALLYPARRHGNGNQWKR